jgi:hypothetical protein
MIVTNNGTEYFIKILYVAIWRGYFSNKARYNYISTGVFNI